MSIRRVSGLSITSAGTVSSSLAYAGLVRGVARHVVLHDINTAKVRAGALDLACGSRFMPQVRVEGSENSEITRGSDVAVITADAKQKPEGTRMGLAASTVNLMKKVIPPPVEYSPEAIFLMMVSPVDVTTYAMLKISGLPRDQLFGSGTVLDSSRLRYLIAEACEIAVVDAHACIASEHGDSKTPLWGAVTIDGVPLLDWEHQTGKLDESTRDSITDQVVNAAYGVIVGRGATSYATRLAATRIIESVLHDEHRVPPVSSLMEDQYGIKDVCLSVPTIVDRQGAGHTLRQPLTDGELGCVHESADVIRYTLNSLGL